MRTPPGPLNTYPGDHECDTHGCTEAAKFFCVWGCIEGHLIERVLCALCMRSKRDRVRYNENLMLALYPNPENVFTCQELHLIREMMYVNIDDKYRRVFNHHGDRIWDQ